MEGMRSDLSRPWIWELGRRSTLADSRKLIEAGCTNPEDAVGITELAGQLIILSKYGRDKEAIEILEDAVSNLKKALQLNRASNKAWSYLGMAHRSIARRLTDHDNFPERHKARLRDSRLLDDMWRGGSSTIQDADPDVMERVRTYQERYCPNLDPNAMDTSQVILEHACKTLIAEWANDPSSDVNCGEWLGYVMNGFFHGNLTVRKGHLQGCVLKDLDSQVESSRGFPKEGRLLWELGTTHTAVAFLTPDPDEAELEFEQAFCCFLEAVQLKYPWPEDYDFQFLKKSATYYRDLHEKMYRYGVHAVSTASTSATEEATSAKKENNDSKYEVYGWVTLAVGLGLVAWMTISPSIR